MGLQVFANVEELSIDMKFIRGMVQFEGATTLFSNLKMLKVSHCSATITSHASLVRLLSQLPNLDQLQFSDSSFQELVNSSTKEAPTKS